MTEIKPGFHFNVPFDVYVRDPAPKPSLNNSTANVLLNQSPHHAWHQHARLNPHWKQDDDTKFDIGKVAHDVLLRGDGNVCIIDADSWRTKAAKEQRDAALISGQIPILSEQYGKVVEMVGIARAFVKSSQLSGIFEEAKGTEVTMLWTALHKELGFTWCRGRQDLMHDEVILDYKSTGGTASPRLWARNHLVPMGNDVQARFYQIGDKALNERETEKEFVFLVQEDEPPYCCSLVTPDSATSELAQRKVERALQIWCECLLSNKWPGYPEGIYVADALPFHEAAFEDSELDRRQSKTLTEFAA